MRGTGEILLVSTYELGHAPHGIAVPMAFFERAGFRPAALDVSVEGFREDRASRARLAIFSVPMHTALRLAIDVARRIRALRPDAVLAFHGVYAVLNAELLRAEGAQAILGAECEDDLVALAQALETGLPVPGRLEPEHVSGRPPPGRPPRLLHPVPSRGTLPGPERYARFVGRDGEERLAGYAEATRGCKHLCRHCPIPAVYGGRFVAIPVEVVLQDIENQVRQGILHVTFGDPDFLNGPLHALRVARGLAERFPGLTFDFTAKIQHLVAHPEVLRELARLGGAFVTSAVESFSNEVLEKLAKGHTREDALRAFTLCEEAGIPLRPTFVPFTPWETLEGYLDLTETLVKNGWLSRLDPVQLSLRLLVPKGSLLEKDPSIAFTGYDPERLTLTWRHPDPRMDALSGRVSDEVLAGAAAQAPANETMERIQVISLKAAGVPHRHVRVLAGDERRVPRLSESWFC